MRYLAVLALLLAAGCADIADRSDLRSPQTAAEWQEFNEHKVRVDRVWGALQAGNRDLCGRHCAPRIGIGPASGIGAWSTGDAAGNDYIDIGFPMLRHLRDDDELAYLVAHEWAHHLLGHRKGAALGHYMMETQADCVGSMLAARAGYRLGAGVEPLRRLTYSTFAAWTGQLPDALPRAQHVHRVAAAAQGRPITRETIRQVCGAGP